MTTYKHEPIYDPLGIEIFVIEESFESMFNGLRGIYYRLYFKESLKPEGERDLTVEKAYYKRFEEINRLKKSYTYNDWELKREAVDLYQEEFKAMSKVEVGS